MFSPATGNVRRKSLKPAADRQGQGLERDAPATPLPSFSSPSSRPTTGTPAPWSSRLSFSFASRSPTLKHIDKADASDQTQPVFISQFPQAVRNAQANLLQNNLTTVNEKRVLTGGIDKGTSLAWMICGSELFIWSYSSSSVAKKCVALDIPSSLVGNDGTNHWAVCIVKWQSARTTSKSEIEVVFDKSPFVGIILCNLTTQGIVYWPDIFSDRRRDPIVDLPKGAEENSNIPDNGTFSSIIASAPDSGNYGECIAVACQPNGILWSFQFTPDAIHRRKISESLLGNEGYVRSLVWQPRRNSSDLSFFLLTDNEVQYWSIVFSPSLIVKNTWTHIVVGDDGDLGIKKDLAGQKHVWLLDLQVDERGRELSILVATFCKDRASSSNYTQYSLLTMLYNKPPNTAPEHRELRKERILEKKAPLQVIIPKAQVEDEEILFSMKLRVGGKPSGSVTILSADGTATVAHHWRGSMRLYQFDLPWDAGKVMDCSILPVAAEAELENEGGAWVVLTEKAGIWAIPEKAVLVGGVEPPERSLSRKGSSNEGIREEEKRLQAFGVGNVAPRRISSEAWRAGSLENKQRTVFSGVPHRGASDEEAEALLFRSFHDFVLSDRIEEDLLEKLRNKGAFDKEGETNVFSRTSRSIVDTLAKHWTTNRVEMVASTVISSLLVDKQQKHQKFLQFLALSKCHEELSLKQRNSMLSIMEHGEKLSSLIHLRELQNTLLSHQEKKPSHAGSLWKLIQLVGEKARRNNVILMDRDNVEVFYSKVSDLEEFFSCLSHYLDHIITPDNGEHTLSPLRTQMDHAFELSSACINLIQSALQYRHDQNDWYPTLEGLTPWNSQPVVRSGLWVIAFFLTELFKEAAGMDDMSVKEELLSLLQGLTDAILEAYTSSITAKIERGEESQGLSLEYHARRDQLLTSLYQLAKVVAESKYQELSKGAEDLELKGSIFREVNSAVMLTAMRHGGYQTLWDMCYDLSDAVLLRNLMHECFGLSRFAFEQLIKRREYGKLLRLGEEFPEDLAHFLKDTERIDLSWLHHIYLKDFPSASDTLHALALSPSTLPQPKRKSLPPSLPQRKRFLYLSKIAALAGQDEGFEMKIVRIEADLRILKLQEEIMEGDDDTKERQEPLGALELIRRCLMKEGRNIRDLSLKAFEVFAWTSSSFRESNRSLLEECWLNATDQDDWPAIYQASLSEGWTDEIILQSLQETVLYRASSRCYGPDAQIFEGTFEDVLPLRREDGSSSPSVEQVLLQHRYFPDAGKLMLTALIMGKESTHYAAEDESVAMDT